MVAPQKIKKKKAQLLYDGAIPFLGIYLEELKAGVEQILAQLCSQQHYS